MNPEEEIFNAAAALPESERAAFLNEACAGRPEFREFVETLLRSHEAAGFMNLTGADEIETQISPLERRLGASGEKAGDFIGRYRLLQQIGEGGFGVVWMAEQTEPVNRRVALKVIKAGMDTSEVIARFEQERQALAMMDHPNIAQVFDGGATETGRPFFVMELVKGIPITQFCDVQMLNTRRRLELFTEVCAAISHAHQKGVIHRDIKPTNVMVTLHGDKPVPKVIDFGIAKATQGRLTERTLFTKFEQFVGTPAYMSPEQAAMSGLDIDTRSDIYGLGILLYELLTGKPPFDAKSLIAAGYDEMRRIIREVEPQKPSTRLNTIAGSDRTTVAKARHTVAEKLNRTVAPDLDWIVMKAIEKDRSRRYETANGLAKDIQCFLADEPVSAGPPGAGYRFRKFARRHRAFLRTAVAVTVLLISATAVSTWLAIRAFAAEKEANRKTADEAAARQDAEMLAEFLSDIMRSPDPARDGRKITVAELLDKAAAQLETRFAGQPERKAKFLSILGRTYQALGLYDEAVKAHGAVRDYYQMHSGPDNAEALLAVENIANVFDDTGRHQEAYMLREDVLKRRTATLGENHRDTGRAMAELAVSYYGSGRRDQAIGLREKTLAINKQTGPADDTGSLLNMLGLAFSYFDAGRRKEALDLREKTVAVLIAKDPSRRLSLTPSAMSSLALSYADAGRNREALEMGKESLRLIRETCGDLHSFTLDVMNDLAILLFNDGQWAEAIEEGEKVLELRREHIGEVNGYTIWSMSQLADYYFRAGRRAEAMKLRMDVLRLRQKIYPIGVHLNLLGATAKLAESYAAEGQTGLARSMRENIAKLLPSVREAKHPDIFWAKKELAASRSAAGELSEAQKLNQEACDGLRAALGADHQLSVCALEALAETCAAAGKWEEALEHSGNVYEWRARVSGKSHPETIHAMTALAVCLRETGRAPEALLLQKSALDLAESILPPGHDWTIQAMGSMEACLTKTGQEAEAAAMRKRLEAIQPGSVE